MSVVYGSPDSSDDLTERPAPIVFFDLGWTLEDEAPAQVDRARHAAAALSHLGIQVTPRRILELQEEGARELAPEVFPYALASIAGPRVADAVAREVAWNKGLLRLYPESRAVLAALAPLARLGVIANQSAGAPARLARHGIAAFLETIASSHEAGVAKPDPAIFIGALNAMPRPHGEIWMIGDRIDNDIAPAKALGWRTVRVLQGYNRHQQPRSAREKPEFNVESIGEVAALLERELVVH